MKISHKDYEFISEFAMKKAGISLQPGKEYLVENRLKPLILKQAFGSFNEYIDFLKANPRDKSIIDKTIDALTINETSFFRDQHPFEHLKNTIIPDIIESNTEERTLSIWSAACSSGQEIYSIAILLKENFPQLESWNIKLCATDISTSILERARSGIYTKFEANRGLSPEIKSKYFKADGDNFELIDSVKKQVDFTYLNFMDTWNFEQKFDIILIRNVLIYFDLETKKSIFQKIKEQLNPNGHLFLGSSETTYNIDSEWKSTGNKDSTTYQLQKN